MTASWQVYAFLLYETIDFILPWVCFAVTEHRRFQNVERSRSVIFQIYRYDHMFYVICDLLLDRRTETQNRYVTFTITGSKTGSQSIFFLKIYLPHCSPFTVSCPYPTDDTGTRWGVSYCQKTRICHLVREKKVKKILFLIMRDFTDFSRFSDTSIVW